MRAKAQIVETRKRYEATIPLSEIRKRFHIPDDAIVTVRVACAADVRDVEFEEMRVVYERVK